MPCRLSFIVALALSASACSQIKEFAPIRMSPIYPRVPNQQRLVSQSALQAVEKATANLSLAQYAGRKVRVEVNGVFPHDETDLLNYIASAVEGAAAQAGAKVLPRPDPRFATNQVVVAMPGAGAPATGGMAPASGMHDPATDPADVRLVASVDWGGIDLKDHKYTTAWPLVGQILVGVLMPGPGTLMALMWAALDDSTAHEFTMTGRVRVTLRGIPLADGLPATMATGEGESSIVIDTDSDTGYSLIMDLPKESSEPYPRQAQ